jgi:glyoxylase-like metal-dependent hydrolase (beta-lactamase superfamily II)
VTIVWELLADGVFRCRLPFLDVTVGIVYRRAAAVLIDSGTTLTEARSIARDVRNMAGREVGHIVLTHNHFDHVLGASAFDGAEIYCAPEVAATMAERTDHDLIAVVTGSDATVVFCGGLVEESGDPSIDADSDPVAWPSTLDRVIEAGGDNAVFVRGHGAVVDAAFIRGQQEWLLSRL